MTPRTLVDSTTRRRTLAVAAAASLVAGTLALLVSPSSADVTSVTGSAYGVKGAISLFGGPPMLYGPTPQVTLPPGGSATPVSSSVNTLQMSFGPAVFFRSGPATVTTQGTPGPTGSVTSSTSFGPTAGTSSTPCNFSYVTAFTANSPVVTAATANFTAADIGKVAYSGFLPPNNPHPDSEQKASIVSVESATQATLSVNATGDGSGYLTIDRSVGSCIYNSAFSADTASTTCTTNEAGTTAATHFTKGLLVTETDDYQDPTVVVAIPDDPAPNTTIDGYFWLNGSSKESFTYVLNEQILNPDGSLTVNAAHLTPRGQIAYGDAYFGSATCGGTVGAAPSPPTFAVSDVSVPEGDAGTTPAGFVVTRSGDSSATATVKAATTNGTATVASGDYAVVASQTLTFLPGETTKTVNANVNGDTVPEANETFNLILSRPTGATIADNKGIATITNDDTVPSLSAGDISVFEGDSGTTNATFTITRSGTTTGSSTVKYKTVNGTATTVGLDYTAIPTKTLTFAPGEITKTVSAVVKGDVNFEADETFSMLLSMPTIASISDDTAVATIQNDDLQPHLSINNVTTNEGNAGTTPLTFTITRSGNTLGATTVKWKTTAGSALASDFTAVPNTVVTFGPGVATVDVTVNVKGDILVEPDETFTAVLSSPTAGADITNATGVGTIANDD